MANTYARATEIVNELKAVANDVRNVRGRIKDLLSLNSSQSIDWTNAVKPASLSEDADGNLTGFTFTRANVGNSLNSLLQLCNLLENVTATTGDHLGNINLISSATVR